MRSGSGPSTNRTVERGIVGADCAGADQHGVAFGAQPVGVGPRRLAGDPLARAVGRRRAAIERGGQLQHNPGPSGRAVLHVGSQLRPDLFGQHPDLDVDAGGAQLSHALATDVRVRVFDADDDALDAGVDDGGRARPGAALVAARFECRVQRGASRGRTGGGQRRDLGVGSARRCRRPFERAAVVGQDNRADPGVG